MRNPKRNPRQSLRNQLADSERWNNFYAVMAGIDPVPLPIQLPEKRAYTKRTDTGPTEAQVLKSVLSFLRSHPQIATVERSQSGMFIEGNRRIRVGFVGKLDVTFMTKQGRYGEIEVKRPGGKPTDAQAARIEKIKAGGGISGCVTCIEDVEGLFK